MFIRTTQMIMEFAMLPVDSSCFAMKHKGKMDHPIRPILQLVHCLMSNLFPILG